MNRFFKTQNLNGTAALLCCLFLFLLPDSGLAQTRRYVTENGSGDGTTWAKASGDLQAMIDAVAAVTGGGEVWVAAGTYTPIYDAVDAFNGTLTLNTGDLHKNAFVLKEGVKDYGGFSGAENVREQRDWVTNKTVLSGDHGTTPGTDLDDYAVFKTMIDVNNEDTQRVPHSATFLDN
ncbi:MAG: hypothetical protein LBT42_04760, partial [Tannerella sp.]|nr:hypothetical protein [Tannerella sp.]